MNRRIHAVTIFASFAALAAGCAQFPGSGQVSDGALKNRLSHTCKNPNPANIFREPDGGYHESAQGGLSGPRSTKARAGQPPIATTAWTWPPANRPVYSVHYEMTGFKSNECGVSGMTVTCSRVLKP